MQRTRHSSGFKEQALSKARQRGSRTLEAVAGELNLSLGTLKGWLKVSAKHAAGSPHAANLPPGDVPARQWSPAQRLVALNQSHGLAGPALHAWCREKGLFEHQLKQWREAFCAIGATNAPQQRQANAALRELQGQHEQLQRELRRKDKALAEAAALLVLQKKFQALWADEDK
jgi:Transposase